MISYQQASFNAKKFQELFNESTSFDEFYLMCCAIGLSEMATKEFFEKKLFAVLFDEEFFGCSGELLKLKIFLMKNLKKLNDFYNFMNGMDN